jgi:AcrR family transcriptional regulator
VSDETRDRLIEVAREILTNRGYVGLTMRTAAAAAGVTPDVARRYYRNRDALLAAALKLPVDPTTALPTLLAPGIEGMGERLVRFTFDLLSDAGAREELMSLARTGVAAGHATAGMQEFIEHSIVDRLAGIIGVPDARMRSALISSYLLGVVMNRYALRIEPLASASEEDVIRMVAPVIQDLLDPRKPLPGSDRSRSPQSTSTSSASASSIPAPPTPKPGEPAQVPPRVRRFDPDPAATARRIASTDIGDD